jgi:hypothetical protein
MYFSIPWQNPLDEEEYRRIERFLLFGCGDIALAITTSVQAAVKFTSIGLGST